MLFMANYIVLYTDEHHLSQLITLSCKILLLLLSLLILLLLLLLLLLL